jgi:GTPase
VPTGGESRGSDGSAFVDEAQVHVKGGNGGAGAVSFRREAHVPRGGPDGGDGGRGGNVILEASRNVVSLLAFRDHPHRRAGDGKHGSGGRRNGRAGSDLLVIVPEGTILRDQGSVVADLSHHGDSVVAGAGGRGGRGNAAFLSNRRRAPGFAEQGEVGEERWLDLELKLFADVALVGFPNSGKSTLISRISAARPKIAAYPFTTLEPHLGVVRIPGREQAEIIVADIPGLVEGASEGRGLGHRFLRHVERARVLVVLVDLAPPELYEGRPPAQQLETLLEELRKYRPALAERPRIVAGSRADLSSIDTPSGLASFESDVVISAMRGDGLDELVGRMARLVAAVRRDEQEGAPPPALFRVVHRPRPESAWVEREGEVFVVHGKAAERAVAVSDLTNPAALEHVRNGLRRLSVDKALARAGARSGDTVRIGEMTFTYEPDA